MSEKKIFFLKNMLLIGVLFILTGVFSFIMVMDDLNNVKDIHSVFSGNSIKNIKENLVNAYNLTPEYSKNLLIVIWVLFFLIVIAVFIWDKFIAKKETVKVHLNYKKFETDLDVLYNLLKEKKRIKIKTIANIFKISQEKALEWAKILESGNLATIEYSGIFGNPEIALIKREEIEKNGQKESKQKIS